MTVLSASKQAWDVLQRLKMVCYFPQAHSWQYQWLNWNGAAFAGDIAKIKALNANAVNLRVDTISFGYPTPDPTMMARLAMLIDMADKAGLKVTLTCFDNLSTFTDIPGSQTWLSTLLTPYANDPRIAWIHLKNEVTPTASDQMAWCQSMIPYARTIAGTIPISVSTPDSGGWQRFDTFPAALSPVAPDFWDWHWYPSSVDGLCWPMLNHVIQKDIGGAFFHVGETGSSTFSTYSSVLNGIPASTAAVTAFQEYWVRVIAQACKELGVNFHVWMLYDVNQAGAPAQAHDYSYAFGFYDAGGTIKAAGTTLASIWGGGAISQDFNGGMDTGVDDGSGTNNVPSLWHVFKDANNTGTITWDSATGHTSLGSAKFSGTTGTPALWISPVSSHVTPGRTVTATCYAQGSSLTGTNRITIDFFDLSGVFVSEIGSSALPVGNSTWTLLTATGTVPANAAYVRIYLKAGGNSGTVWFDDVTWTKS